jgi:translin
MELGIAQIQESLTEKEKNLDAVMLRSRLVVRMCSNAIKAMHSSELEEAKKSLAQAGEGVRELEPLGEKFPSQVNHVLQEYSEARIVLSAIVEKKIPSYQELGVPEVAYISGLLDAVGELKREMYECLRKGNKEDAEIYFKMMEEIFNELLPLRFSNAILPEFRRKQDSARHQIEQARGVLL